MKIYTAQDFQALISMLPNSPDNNPVYQALAQMVAETQVVRHPYTFEVDFSSGAGLLAGQFAAPGVGLNTPGNFLVDSSAPFMLQSLTYEADIAGAAKTEQTNIVPNATVFISPQSSNRNLMNVAVPVPSLFGRGRAKAYLHEAYWLPANTNVTVTLYNFEAVNTNNIRLSFHGYRLYSN